MKLRKDNVVKIVESKSEIRRLKEMGFEEVAEPVTTGDNNDDDGQGAGTPAPSSVSERDVLKAQLDELGIEYKSNTPTEKLKKLLEGHDAKDDEA